ncbi:MAG: type I-E CRISPR-associated protein Cas7/Cse4/CasC [Planctomycetota bacterium]
MWIEIHAIQNHSPANLNRADLGAPKSGYFGGVLRSRISSQCIKRSIRLSAHFAKLLGGIRTRQLPRLIAEQLNGDSDAKHKAERILDLCGFKAKKARQQSAAGDGPEPAELSRMLVFTTGNAIRDMATLLKESDLDEQELAQEFARLITERVAVPDMALSGRMLEPDKSAKKLWQKLNTTVDAALQVAHAISTHEARPEIDYYVATDDLPGEDAGAGYVDEAMFASACFYKYFSIHWETLIKNLRGYGEDHEKLAAHTVGAFIRGAALVNPTGKQNSFAAHNLPDGILIQFRDSPLSYANAFAKPVSVDDGRGLISQSIAQLAQYIRDLDTGYGAPEERFWFSPNLRHPLEVVEGNSDVGLADKTFKSVDELVPAVIKAIGHDWEAVQRVVLSQECA